VVKLRVARDARPEAALFVDQTVQVVAQSRDQSEVLSPVGLVGVVVDVPDVSQKVFEELFFFHRI